MSKKLTKHGNSLALVIDKPILEMLKINEKTMLELSIKDGALIIRPFTNSSKNKKEQEIDEIAERIIDKYQDVFKKLSKT
jgi:antitoxin MazE